MAKSLTDAQAAFLQSMIGNQPHQGTPRGLVARGYLTYRWGFDASFGYVVTRAGRDALQAHIAANVAKYERA